MGISYLKKALRSAWSDIRAALRYYSNCALEETRQLTPVL